MPRYKRSFVGSDMYSLYSTDDEYFNLYQANLEDNFFTTAMNSATDGKFKAIVLSGMISGETTGTAKETTTEARIVTGEDDQMYWEVKVRPLNITYGAAIPDPCSMQFATDRAKQKQLIEMHEWARSEFPIESGDSLAPAQEIVCYYELGSISNSTYNRLRFEKPKVPVIRTDCLLAFNMSLETTKDLFSGKEIDLSQYDTTGEHANTDQKTDNGGINATYQIPNTILPFPPEIGRITSILGTRIHPVTKVEKKHNGVDVGMPKNTPMYAVAKGTVVVVNRNSSGFGYLVGVKHVLPDNSGKSQMFHLWYGHCEEILVKNGDQVNQGDTIALCGNRGVGSGPHLHMEFHMNGKRSGGNTKDPVAYLGWYGRVEWKPNGSEDQWKSENPTILSYTPDQLDETFPESQVEETYEELYPSSDPDDMSLESPDFQESMPMESDAYSDTSDPYGSSNNSY